jgi:uncharacterized RDD family membrane protein YckC
MDAHRHDHPKDPDAELVEAELIEPDARPAPSGPVDTLAETAGRAIAPFARAGWRGARGVSRRLGIDRALGKALDRGVDRALQSDVAERAADRVLGSDAAKRAWGRVLESEEAQQLVERVAEAPEVRSAITSQGVGLLEDVRRSARKGARRLDGGFERFARRVLRRPQRTGPRPAYAGAATRGLAIALDAAILAGMLLVVSTLIALLVSTVTSWGNDGAQAITIAFGAIAWIAAAGVYLAAFWTLAERTPGMTFFALRIVTEGGGTVPPGQDLRRLVGFALATIPALLGFAGILLDERRRGWHDRFAGTVVLYADPELDAGVDKAGRRRT